MGRSAELTLKFSNNVEGIPDNLIVVEGWEPEGPPELSFGQYLRRERILRGISREEILHVTKVSPEYLDALEADRFDGLPPRAFIVGFLRVVSRYAGLNGDEVVNRFLTQAARKEAYEESGNARMGFWKRHFKFLLGMTGLVCLVALMIAPLFKT